MIIFCILLVLILPFAQLLNIKITRWRILGEPVMPSFGETGRAIRDGLAGVVHPSIVGGYSQFEGETLLENDMVNQQVVSGGLPLEEDPGREIFA